MLGEPFEVLKIAAFHAKAPGLQSLKAGRVEVRPAPGLLGQVRNTVAALPHDVGLPPKGKGDYSLKILVVLRLAHFLSTAPTAPANLAYILILTTFLEASLGHAKCGSPVRAAPCAAKFAPDADSRRVYE